MLTTGQTHEKPHRADSRRGGVAVRRLVLGGLFAVFAGVVEDGLANLWIIDRADAATAILIEAVVGQGGPQNILVGGAESALNMETASVAVTDRGIALRRGECLVNGGDESALATRQGERATSLRAVLTGGGGFGFGAGGTHEGGGCADVVFHNDARLIPSLGYVKRESEESEIYFENCDLMVL